MIKHQQLREQYKPEKIKTLFISFFWYICSFLHFSKRFKISFFSPISLVIPHCSCTFSSIASA